MKINRVFRLERISHMLISTIQSMDSLPMMKQSGIDAVIVSFEKVSIRTEKISNFHIERLEKRL